MKLVRVIAFAVFFVAAPVASPAQSLDLPLPSSQCTDEYYDDAADQCGAISGGQVLTIEARGDGKCRAHADSLVGR